ncbi:MAG: FGGY family carbohydrate kinase [Balneolaceae bacterium]
MAERSVTAIFDIGKTNKKFLLFDDAMEVVHTSYTTLPETVDDDGYPSENLDELVSWMFQQLEEVVSGSSFSIRNLNISTYGASLVHLDREGRVAAPFYNYLKPCPEELLEEFYARYGGQEQFALETASPPMGMLNSGLQLYWLRERKPDLFRDIHTTLHFPQYLASLFTGRYLSELTSIGCHTGLWDFRKWQYHEWLEKESFSGLLPPVKTVTTVLDGGYNEERFTTGTGIHDSSSALVPYLYGLNEPFLLLSTGTWNIAMNPFSQDPLTFEELKKDTLCYINVYGEPVKAARFFLGSEYAHQKSKIEKQFGKLQESRPDPGLVDRLVMQEDISKQVTLERAHTSGPYPSPGGDPSGRWDPARFASGEEAHHQLLMDLVSIQADSIRLALGRGEIRKIVVTGGFSHNPLFLGLLGARFPDMEVYTDSLSHASALGAAMVLRDRPASAGEKLKEQMALKRQEPLRAGSFHKYRWNP